MALRHGDSERKATGTSSPPSCLTAHGVSDIGRRSSVHAIAPPRGDLRTRWGYLFRGSAVSRTDAHAPFHVRIARREVAVIPVHRCPGGECDLPDLVAGWVDARSRCYWQFTFTGRYICSCWMCHWHRRPGQRCAVVRAQLRAAAREWNGGEREDGWEV